MQQPVPDSLLGKPAGRLEGRYDVGGAGAQLLLVQYPDAKAASAGLTALRQAQDIALEGSQVDGLVAAEARDNLLDTVFGDVNEATADTLLAGAL